MSITPTLFILKDMAVPHFHIHMLLKLAFGPLSEQSH